MSKEKRQLDRFVDRHGDGEPTVEPTTIQEMIGGPFVVTDEIKAVRDRIRRWFDVPRPVHLVGPTGCGKTALALAIAATRDRPVVWMNGNEMLNSADLVGEYAGKAEYKERDNYVSGVVKKKSFVRDQWVDNPLSVAVQNGATFIYNEFARTKPAAHNVLLSVFEEGVLDRPGQRGDDRTVDVDPAFRAILVSNSTEYAGIHRPQDALLDRLIGVHLGYYGRETEFQIVRTQVQGLEDERIERVIDVIRKLRDRLDFNVGTRAAVMVAEGLTVFDEEDALAGVCRDVLASKVDSKEALGSMQSEIDDVTG